MLNKITISPGAYIFMAMMLMLLPVRWCMAVLLSAVVHELSHLWAVHMRKGRIVRISIGFMGAQMETSPLSPLSEVICAAAGPLGSLLFAVSAAWYPEAAICAAAQGVYNLLPIYPLDGGRIFRSLLPEPVYTGIAAFTVTMLLGTGIWLAVTAHMGFFTIIPGAAACLRCVQIKFPCKQSKNAVQ